METNSKNVDSVPSQTRNMRVEFRIGSIVKLKKSGSQFPSFYKIAYNEKDNVVLYPVNWKRRRLPIYKHVLREEVEIIPIYTFYLNREQFNSIRDHIENFEPISLTCRTILNKKHCMALLQYIKSEPEETLNKKWAFLYFIQKEHRERFSLVLNLNWNFSITNVSEKSLELKLNDYELL